VTRQTPGSPARTRSGPDIDLGLLPELMGYMLRQAQITMFQDFHATFTEMGIRPVHFAVLEVLHRNPGLRQAQAGEALGIKAANLVPLLNDLQARGFVRRDAVAGDRRSYALHLTVEGAAQLKRLQALVATHERRFAARLGPGGREQLLALLQRLTSEGSEGQAHLAMSLTARRTA
jgi:DNA-binding MarR family transcriptional regulator